MNEHALDAGLEVRAPKARRLRSGEHRHAPETRDLVIDLSGVIELDVTSLSLLLTARHIAEKEGKNVWLVGLHLHLWEALSAMGLAGLFMAFPVPQEAAV